MGRQIKAIYKKAESSFNNPEHQKKWQGGVGILVMVVFVLSSVLFNKTVQAVIQSAGNYGYYNNGYGYGGTADDGVAITADAIPATPTAISCTGTTDATCTVTHSGKTTTDTSAGTLTARVEIYTGSVSGSSCSGSLVGYNASGTGTTSIVTPTAISGLTASTAYCVVTHVTDAALNDSSTYSTTFTTSATQSGGNIGGGIVTTVPPAPVVPGTPSADTGLPSGTTLVTTAILGKLGDGSAAALQAAGVDPNSTLGKQAIAIADVATDILLGKETTKDTATDKEVREIFEGTLSVVIANLTEVQKGAKGETAGQRAANAMRSVLGNAFTDAVKDVTVATVLAEQLVVPALADGKVSDNLRREIMAALLAKGKTQKEVDALNKKLEGREKAYGPVYLAFYNGVGPEGKKGKDVVDILNAKQTDARWANFLAGAYGARVQDEDRNLGVEKTAIARYDKVFTGKRDGKKLLGPIATLEKGGKLTREQKQRAWNLVQQSAYASVQSPQVRVLPAL